MRIAASFSPARLASRPMVTWASASTQGAPARLAASWARCAHSSAAPYPSDTMSANAYVAIARAP